MAPKIDGKKTLKREMRTAAAKERDALIRQEREERNRLIDGASDRTNDRRIDIRQAIVLAGMLSPF